MVLVQSCASGPQQEETVASIQLQTNGLKARSIQLTNEAGEAIADTVFLGQKVYLRLDGVEGFASIGEGVLAGAGMEVLSKDGELKYAVKDFYEQLESPGLTPDEVESFPFFLEIKPPLVAGNSYQWRIKIWDKGTQDAMEASVWLHVQRDATVGLPSWLRPQTSEASFSDLFLSVADQPVSDNKFDLPAEITFNVLEAKGFTAVDGMVLLAYRSVMEDVVGNPIMEYADTLALEKDLGILQGFVQLGVPLLPGNAYVWKVSLNDLNSAAAIDFSADLIIEKQEN